MKHFPGNSAIAASTIGAFTLGNPVASLLSSNYLPHRYCYLAQPGLVWTNVVADGLIAIAYAAISACLFLIGAKISGYSQLRKQCWLPFSFGAFVASCGVTHIMEVVTIWQPLYPLSAAFKVVCAAISVPTALFLGAKAPSLLANLEGIIDALANSAMYRAQVDAIDCSQMVIELDMDGTVLAVNTNYTHDFGYKAEEIVGKLFSVVVTELDIRSGAYESFWNALRAGQFQRGQYQRVTKSGEPIWIEATYNPILDAQGSPVKVVGLLSDVSARVRMELERERQEKALRKSEEILEETGKLAGVAGWEIDLATNIVTWTPGLYRLLGADPSYQSSVEAGLHRYSEQSRPLMAEALERARTDGRGWDLEVSLVRLDGRPIWAHVVGRAECENGRPVRLFGAFQDITARIDEREALRWATERAELATESGGIGIWDWDLETNLLGCDAQMYRMVHRDYKANHKNYFEFWSTYVYAEDRGRVEAELLDAIAGGKAYDTEFRITLDDGIHFVKASGQVTRDKAGKAVRMVGTNIDVTARVREQEALKRANLRTNLATDSGKIGIWEWDLARNILVCDEWMYRLWGCQADRSAEQYLEFWTRRVHPEDRGGFESALQDGVNDVRPYDFEFRVVWDDLSIRWIKGSGLVDRDPSSNEPIRMIGTNFDITERVLEKVALQEANLRAKLATDSVGIGIWEWNVPSGTLRCDERNYRLWGLEPEPGVEHPLAFWVERIHPGDQELVSRRLEEALNGVRPYDVEFRILCADGSERWMKSTGLVDRDESGSPLRMVGTGMDVTARVKERLALEEANERIALATESSGLGIWEWDIVNNRRILDQRMLRLYDLESHAGKPLTYESWAERLHPEDRAAAEQAARDALEGKCPLNNEFRIVWNDGSIHHVRATAKVVRDNAGDPIRMFGTNLEITERKLAEEILIDQASLLEISHDSIMVRDLDGTITFWNHGAEEMYGFTKQQTLGRISHDILRTVFPLPLDEIERKFLERERWEGELIHTTADGRRVVVASRWVLKRDKNGLPSEIMEINSDVTDQRSVEEALRRSVENEQLLIHGVKDYSIVLLDLQGNVTTWNEGAESIKGYKFEEIIGQNFSVFHTPDAIAAGHPALVLEVTQLKGRFEETGWRVRKDGTLFWANVIVSALYDADGSLRGYGKVTRDITEKKRAEETTEQARVAADEANRAKSEFLANMSHEVRTPVNAIMGMAHLGLRAAPEPRQREYLLKIDMAAKRLLSIMNDILDFSKIEAGKLQLECIHFALAEVMDNLRDIVEQKAREKKLSLVFSIAPEIPPYLAGDPLRLGQVLINLVNNAIKFTDHGEVRVTVERIGWDDEMFAGSKTQTLLFSIADTGIGMTASQMANLFQAFHQADTSFTRQYGGTGLGLAISKQLVEMMGGAIGTDSKLGVGSTFSFTVRFGRGERPVAKTSRHDRPFNRTASKILVVDDSEITRDELIHMLRSHGQSGYGTPSAEEALTMLIAGAQQGSPFDLVVMDWRLPGINGVEASHRIRQNLELSPPPKIVIISAFDRQEVVAATDTIPFDEFLTKPVAEEEFLRTIRSLLAEQPIPAATVFPVASDPGLLAGRQVLLVEDNDLNRDLAMELLSDLGIAVTVAVDGQAAIDMVRARPFDLVLMDIQMPVMDGLTATRAIRAEGRFRHLPIVAMTAHAMNGDYERSLAAGMNDHITKPVDPDGLTKTLLRWMPSKLEKTTTAVAIAIKPPVASPSVAPSSPVPNYLPPFNIPAALLRTNNKPLLLRKLLIGFREQYADAVAEFKAFLQEEKWPEAQRLVHSLKSIAGMLETRPLAEAASALEAALRDGQRSGLERMIEDLNATLQPAVAAVALLEGVVQDTPAQVIPAVAKKKDRALILVVDDQAHTLDLVSDTFADEYDVITASAGEEALSLAILKKPEVVLLDVDMPGMNGFEVCRRLKNDPRTREIPVIFVTGLNDALSETKGLTLGAVDYVSKPLNPAVMRVRVQNQFKLKQAQVELFRLLAKRYLDDMVNELEESLMRARLREIEYKLKEGFLSHVSHELRSPLASIYSFVSIVSDRIAGDINEQQEEYLRIAMENIDQLRSMVDDLLDATRLRSGQLEIAKERLDIRGTIQLAIDEIQCLADNKHIPLTYCVADEIGTVVVDPVRMRQSLLILLDNAIKFTPSGGTVCVSVSLAGTGSELLIEVADTGCGISPDLADVIFDRLYQVNSTDSNGRLGLGLGLHIAKELIRRQGGNIWVESVLGKGSKFSFTVLIEPG